MKRVVVLLTCLVSTVAFGAPETKPYLSPSIVISPDAAGLARVKALSAAPAAPLSANAPGLLLAVSPPSFGEDSVLAAVRDLQDGAHRAGWRAGLLVSLTAVPVPTEARAAEAASASSLYPGLGALLSAGARADLVVLSFPALSADVKAQSFILKKVASEVRAKAPSARIAACFEEEVGPLIPPGAATLLSPDAAAFVDLVGLQLKSAATPAAALREAIDKLAFGRPLFVYGPRTASVDGLIELGLRLAPATAPFVAAPVDADPAGDAALMRLARLIDGDFGPDSRAGTARGPGGEELAPGRLVSGTDLGGVIVVPAVTKQGGSYRGPVTLALEAPDYAAAEVFELGTGRSKRFDIPRSATPPRLSLSTASGSIAVRLTAREKAPAEAAKAQVGVSAERGITAEEVLARHQAWRAHADERWTRFAARNKTSIRYRFADLNTTLDQTLEGPFFYERGKGYDWSWQQTYFNGVRWRGKKVPELPLVQPEKVSELPLALTFNDAYTYELKGQETIGGIRCYALDFSPKETVSVKALYAGRVYVSVTDYALVRTETHQLNLEGEVQSVDDATDFTEVPAPDGSEPIRLPTRTRGQWILRTFSRTTVLERETTLSDVRLDPPTFDAEKKAILDSPDTIVRDTDKGLRYLEKNKEGERVVSESAKTSRFFGLGGLHYDVSFDYPLPLLGVYYLDLDFRKKHQQVQVFFAGILLGASFNEPKLFGSKFDLGVDLFGIALRGNQTVYIDGEEDKAQRVKSRAFAANLNVGHPIGRHFKLSGQLGITHNDYGTATETAPDFTIPSNHWVTRLRGQAIYDVSGWAFSAQFAWAKRSQWDPWGYPGNPDYDPGKDEYRTYGGSIAKDFHFAQFRRLRTSISYLGSSNTDRFSRYTFGFFGGTALKGFASGSLQAEKAFIGRAAYGVVLGDTLRIEGLYDHAIVKNDFAGLDWANFGGAGISGQFPGPWTTIVQLDAGVPVVGRNRGQHGFVLNLVFLKIF